MARRKPKTTQQPDGLSLFRALGDYASCAARGRMQKGRLFSLCVRASLSKCYEFNLYAWDNRQLEGAFFSLPTLRGICEEVIVLNYVQHLPAKARDTLFLKLMAHDVHTRLATQEAFFSAARPLQPILKRQLSPTALEALEDEIRAIWRGNGWPSKAAMFWPNFTTTYTG
jgi:hypothetical protein